MNAGKLVAQIAVVAIVVYFCYSAVATAIPTELNDPAKIFGPEGNFEIQSEADGLNMKVTISGAVHSTLPQDVHDVRVQFFLGEPNMRTMIADEFIESIPKGITPINATLTIPTYSIIAYAVTGITEDHKVSIPMAISFSFKYMEWQGTHLVDLGMTTATKIALASGVTLTPEVSSGEHGTKVSVTVDKETNPELIESAIEIMGEGTHTITVPGSDATITIGVTSDTDSYGLSLEATGNTVKNAVDLLSEKITEDGLTLSYGGEEFTLTKANAEAYIALIQVLYDKGVIA